MEIVDSFDSNTQDHCFLLSHKVVQDHCSLLSHKVVIDLLEIIPASSDVSNSMSDAADAMTGLVYALFQSTPTRETNQFFAEYLQTPYTESQDD